ncbi:hypothetical protein [Frisingicoccus sp.]|uniref:hypothetical protein n=1 Tax=Frisingicoccus sp. TaxID=1918627 RepID=UPI003AB57FEE
MSDPKICQNILSIIFNDKEVPAIRIGIAEKTQEPYYDSRAVRMDLLAVDENNVIYDAEVPAGLVEFLKYVEDPVRHERDITDERVRELADQIKMLKNSQEVGVKYMRLWEEMEEARREAHREGLEEGAEIERLESIKKLMETMEWSVEQAMDALKMPETQRQKYMDKIKNIEE